MKTQQQSVGTEVFTDFTGVNISSIRMVKVFNELEWQDSF